MERAYKCTLIYDMRALGKQESEFESYKELWRWHKENPPGPTVQIVYWLGNGCINLIKSFPGTFSWEAYNKAVEDKRWRGEYRRRTGKDWKDEGQAEQKSESKHSADSQPKIDSEKKRLTKDECLELLGLKPGFSQKELQAAWRDAVNKYHPDKFATHFAEFKILAEKRTKQVNQAYDLLRKKRKKAD